MNDKVFQEQIYKIRQAYLKETAGKLETYSRDMRYLENNVAKYPNSNYWKRRLSQVTTNYEKFITERDRFLKEKPAHPEEWIKVQSAVLGLEIKESSQQGEDIISVKSALKELWGLNEITTEKMIGIIVTMAVELSIFLLAFLAAGGNRQSEKKTEIVMERSQGRGDLLGSLISEFGEELVGKFLLCSRDYFAKAGKLLPMKNVAKNLRPVKLFLKDLERGRLEELFR